MMRVCWVSLLLPVVEAKELWSSSAAAYGNIIREAFPIGNAKLGALPFGEPGNEKVNLNVDSLWSGGPFQISNYTGGNPSDDKSQYLPGIREWIFQNGTGNVSQLLGSNDYYGSYRVLGNLTVALDGVNASSVAHYKRVLSLDIGIHSTKYVADAQAYETSIFCSYPSSVCVYQLWSNGSLPEVTVKMDNTLAAANLQNSTCGSGFARLTGVTQLGPPEGMKYDAIVRLVSGSAQASCDSQTGALKISPGKGVSSLGFVIGADTNYDQKRGNAANDFSFKGTDPGQKVEQVTEQAAGRSVKELRNEHAKDYSKLAGAFVLNLPDTTGSEKLETSEIVSQYDISTGDPYLESLLFAYSRHLLISSARPGALPANLQGRWSELLEGAWSVDYHANINLQMNYWGADSTGLGEIQGGLWDYMADTWVPRGEQTAKLLYGAPTGAWVTHDEMNIFGHTAMKSDAQWANYPASGAWMMQHVFDHFDYSQDLDWFQNQGYPLIKGVAVFWLSQIMTDDFFNDGTLVVNNCNSPEHGPTTFACTHYQQLLVQIFSYVLSAANLGAEKDDSFVGNVAKALRQLDTGIHIGAWGEIKEWKVPDSYGYDFQNDTHRHLSHLIGWYPGSSISALAGGYTNSTIQDAVTTSLYSRGNGTGADADAGWEKVWRSACWALLNNTAEADFELRFAISENFAPNGFSMYSGHNTPFQIDANFGLAGAVLSMLVVDLAEPGASYGSTQGDGQTRTVVLGPAIPARWGGGSVHGLRLRGGGVVDFEWDDDGIVTKADVKDRSQPLRVVNKAGEVLVT